MSSTRHPDHDAEQRYIDRAIAHLDAEMEGLERPSSAVDARAEALLDAKRAKRAGDLREARSRICDGKIEREDGNPLYIGRHLIRGDGTEIIVISWRVRAAKPFYLATRNDSMGVTTRRRFDLDGRRLVAISDEQLTGLPAGRPLPELPPVADIKPLGPRVDVESPVTSRSNGSPTPPQPPESGPPEPGRDTGDREASAGAPDSLTDEPISSPKPTHGQQAPATGPALDSVISDLERERGAEMTDIVASIQADQYRLITDDIDGVLAIQGGPGTGKTAVALHRAAWLLYEHEQRLGPTGVLVIGPNRAFMDYIAQVLPSLGETSVAQRELGRLVEGHRATTVDTTATQRLKGDPRIATVLERAVWSLVRVPEETVRIDVAGGTIELTHEDVKSSFDQLRGERRAYADARDRARGALEIKAFESYKAKGLTFRRKPGADEFEKGIRGSQAWQSAFRRMWPSLRPAQVLRGLSDEKRLKEIAPDILTPPDRKRLSKSLGSKTRDQWSDSDLPLLDELSFLIDGRGSTWPYVIVDEAQDLTPMQFRMATRRARGGHMTLVGDIAQSTGAWRYSSWQDIAEHLPVRDDARLAELLIGFRVPAQIMDLASALLPEIAPGLRPPQAVRRALTSPVFRAADESDLFETVVAVVSEISRQRTGKIGVIAHESTHDLLLAAMRARGLRSGDLATDGLREHITVLSATRAKGLEFDQVVVVEPALIYQEARYGASELYVAITRATQHLEIIHSKELPPPLGADSRTQSEPPPNLAGPAVTPELPELTSRFSEALLTAKFIHGPQRRRGSVVPYLSHLMAVAALVLEDGGNEDEAIAALLHDAPEDSRGAAALDEIRTRFGTDVASLVEQCSDPLDIDQDDWRALKSKHIAILETASPSVRRIALAEKLDNVRILTRDQRRIGDATWARMGVDPQDLLWYYTTLSDLFSREHPGASASELAALVAELVSAIPKADD